MPIGGPTRTPIDNPDHVTPGTTQIELNVFSFFVMELDAIGNITFEFIAWYLVSACITPVIHESGKRWMPIGNFVRKTPHAAEGAVYKPRSQIGIKQNDTERRVFKKANPRKKAG